MTKAAPRERKRRAISPASRIDPELFFLCKRYVVDSYRVSVLGEAVGLCRADRTYFVSYLDVLPVYLIGSSGKSDSKKSTFYVSVFVKRERVGVFLACVRSVESGGAGGQK